ncbi:MAG: hypothetical protein A2731_01780 [Candidatus Buchananbacteria bacterium RIFCSPHIGHO2_01_FULL_39_8]|uniref:Uncharacterized protein n=1 Tax=Candidatus Buchananbacteria bacterium RIFCSPHIGHO2_01_FULL_39_8 TaxID=1797533 RepID=A0A1G1Y0A4_9BACT|nr:MAG: hypothetical protein A2731_01780 [Candidatus Buchananbacteria bacterium RIFCSPHIGHO2_01_FULL_39_8]
MDNKEHRIKKIEESLNVSDEIIVPIMTAIKLGCKGRMSREEFNELSKEMQEAIRTNKYGATRTVAPPEG